MRTTLCLVLLLLVAACEKVPILKAQVQGEGLAEVTDYRRGWPQHWATADDWHRLFVAARARPGRLSLFVRTHDDPSKTPPDTWMGEGARRMTLEVSAGCDSAVQYFDNPSNSYANNFFHPGRPDIYPYSPVTEAPGLSAILTVEDCVGPDIGVAITVLDESGAPAREHQLTIRIEQVDWYYNPLFL